MSKIDISQCCGYLIIDSYYKIVVSVKATRESARSFKRYEAATRKDMPRYKIYSLKKQQFVR